MESEIGITNMDKLKRKKLHEWGGDWLTFETQGTSK